MVADRAVLHDADLHDDLRRCVSCLGAVFSGFYIYRDHDVGIFLEECVRKREYGAGQQRDHHQDLYAQVHTAPVEDVRERL